MTSRRGFLAAGAASVLGACAPLRNFPFDVGDPADVGQVEIRFFSVACFLVRFGGLSLLTDPFFSHLSLGTAATGLVVPDPAQVAPYRELLGDVRAITVGHGHYDHVLDLSAVAGDVHPEARVLAGDTTAHVLAPLGLPLEFVPVHEHAATAEDAGSWIEVVSGRLRVLPIVSGHPDNIPGIHLFRRSLSEDRQSPPTRAGHYQEGATLAFLVDWLEAGRVACRVYVQSSSRGLPDGAFPQEILRERGVDVALLAMDCARAQANGRESIQDRLRPRRIFFCHYGDFFRRKDQPRREGVKVNMRRLHRLLPGSDRTEVLFPAWDSVFRFDLEAGQLRGTSPGSSG